MNIKNLFILQLPTVLLIIIGLLCYSFSMQNAFVGDDFSQIVHNTKIHSLSNFLHFFTGSTYESGGAEKATGLFYRPIMALTFSGIYSLFSLSPSYYHALQLFIHIINAILLFNFIKFFFDIRASWIIAAFFLIHPINNESVVYIANMQEVLFFFFGIVSLLLIQKFKICKHNTWIVSLLFLCTLLSKESGILFLFSGIMYSYLFKRNTLKYVLISVLSAIFFYLILRYPLAQMHLTATSIAHITNSTLFERILHIPIIFTYYINTFFIPLNLSSNHFWIIKNITFETFYGPLLVFLSFLVLLAILYAHIQQKAKRFIKTYSYFTLWFLSGIGIHLQLIPLDATVADRWFYFPIVGLLSLFTIAFMLLSPYLKILPRMKWVFIIFLILLYVIINIKRTIEWKDGLTLYSHDILKTPNNFILNNALATELLLIGNTFDAKPLIIASVKEKPYYANLNNLAIVYTSEKKYKDAKAYLKKAVESSGYYMVHENYSNFLITYDDIKEAEIFTLSSLQKFPQNQKLWINLTKIYYTQGKRREAINTARHAYSIKNTHEAYVLYTRLSKELPIDIKK